MDPDLARLRHEDPDQFAQQLIERQLVAERSMKGEITRNGPDDLPNRVAYLAESEDSMNLIVPASIGPMPLSAPEVLSASLATAKAQFGPPFLVAFLAESYMQMFPAEAEPEVRKKVRGDVTASFLRGEPHTSECIGIVMMHRRLDRTLRVLSVHQPFHYEDGAVVFGEEFWRDSLTDEHMTIGAIPEALAAAFGGEQN